MKRNGMRPVPPGMTANALAKAISVPSKRITVILKGERGITGDTALIYEMSKINSVSNNADFRLVKKVRMRGAREIDEWRRT